MPEPIRIAINAELEGITPEELAEAIANLRVLVTACSRFPGT
ncbi:hypothetical protein ACFVW2_28780 [Streptomyces sp. NPDC058171]